MLPPPVVDAFLFTVCASLAGVLLLGAYRRGSPQRAHLGAWALAVLLLGLGGAALGLGQALVSAWLGTVGKTALALAHALVLQALWAASARPVSTWTLWLLVLPIVLVFVLSATLALMLPERPLRSGLLSLIAAAYTLIAIGTLPFRRLRPGTRVLLVAGLGLATLAHLARALLYLDLPPFEAARPVLLPVLTWIAQAALIAQTPAFLRLLDQELPDHRGASEYTHAAALGRRACFGAGPQSGSPPATQRQPLARSNACEAGFGGLNKKP